MKRLALKFALHVLTGSITITIFPFSSLGDPKQAASVCMSSLLAQLGQTRILSSKELEEAKKKVWLLFERDVQDRIEKLTPQNQQTVLQLLRELQWEPLSAVHGHVLVNPRHTEVLEITINQKLQGKIFSAVALRHELEHVINAVERGEHVFKTMIKDLFHPRRIASRTERRAFRAQYELATNIAKEVNPAVLRKILIEESGLPETLHADFDVLLQSIRLSSDGRWVNPLNPKHPDAGMLRQALLDGAGSFTAEQVRIATMRLAKYLRTHLQNPAYAKHLSRQMPGKAALLIVYGIVSAFGSYQAYSFFSALNNEKLDQAQAPQVPPIAIIEANSSQFSSEKRNSSSNGTSDKPAHRIPTQSDIDHICTKIITKFPKLSSNQFYNHSASDIEAKYPGLARTAETLGIGVFDVVRCLPHRAGEY